MPARPSPEAAAELRRRIKELAADPTRAFIASSLRPLPEGCTDGQVGAAFVALHRAGVIRPCGTTLSSHRHGGYRLVTVWTGTGGES
jgi:hypothetical protein